MMGKTHLLPPPRISGLERIFAHRLEGSRDTIQVHQVTDSNSPFSRRMKAFRPAETERQRDQQLCSFVSEKDLSRREHKPSTSILDVRFAPLVLPRLISLLTSPCCVLHDGVIVHRRRGRDDVVCRTAPSHSCKCVQASPQLAKPLGGPKQSQKRSGMVICQSPASTRPPLLRSLDL
jgi:hypothetical protein